MRLLLVVVFLVSTACTASAELRMFGKHPPEFGAGIFPSAVVGIGSQPNGLSPQRRSNWCWAASAAYILRQQGVPVTQEQVVARLFNGQLPNTTANANMISAALSGWGLDYQGRTVRISSKLTEMRQGELLDELKAGRPVLMAATTDAGTGHAYVIVNAHYIFPPKNSPYYQGGEPRVLEYLILDPWPYSPRFQVWDHAYLMKHLRFLAYVHVNG